MGALDYAEHVASWTLVGDGHRPFQPFEEIDPRAVDGVLGVFYEHEWAARLGAAGVAAVNTSTRLADLALPRVGNDDAAIGRMGAEHLLGLGFPAYGFVGGAAPWYSERRGGAFQQVVEGDAGAVCHRLSVKGGGQHIMAALSDWLPRIPRPIAVMAATDVLARMVVNTAIECGIRIPEDLAVLGVDNDRWATATAAVPLSSIEPNARQIGYRAAKLLDRLMAGEAPGPPQWVPPLGVVTRRSTDILLAEDPLVVDALHFIREHCGEDLHVEDVLAKLLVSRRTLETRMKRATGKTPQAAIYQARIERARPLLVNSDESLGEIARACGFERQERFSLVFKRLMGTTPGQYRRRRELGDG